MDESAIALECGQVLSVGSHRLSCCLTRTAKACDHYFAFSRGTILAGLGYVGCWLVCLTWTRTTRLPRTYSLSLIRAAIIKNVVANELRWSSQPPRAVRRNPVV